MRKYSLIFLFILSACATNPYARYDSYNCNQIKAEIERTQKKLEPYNDSTLSSLDSAAKIFGTFSHNYNYYSKKDALLHRLDYLEQLNIYKDCVK